MIVYRFEREGLGPYMGRIVLVANSVSTWVPNKHALKKSKRIRKQVPLNINNYEKAHKSKEMLYGCASKDFLRAYFGYKFKPLFQAGYRIKQYTVPDNEVINMGIEVAFPVKYHKFRTMKKLNAAVIKLYV